MNFSNSDIVPECGETLLFKTRIIIISESTKVHVPHSSSLLFKSLVINCLENIEQDFDELSIPDARALAWVFVVPFGTSTLNVAELYG